MVMPTAIRQPAAPLKVPIVRFAEFDLDTGDGSSGGTQPGWETALENNKLLNAQDFVARSVHYCVCHDADSSTFVDTFTNAGVTPSPKTQRS